MESDKYQSEDLPLEPLDCFGYEAAEGAIGIRDDWIQVSDYFEDEPSSISACSSVCNNFNERSGSDSGFVSELRMTPNDAIATAEEQRIARLDRKLKLESLRQSSKNRNPAVDYLCPLTPAAGLLLSRAARGSCVDPKEERLRQSTLRNRENARRAREKAKTLMQDLQSRIALLERENAELRGRVRAKLGRIPRIMPYSS
mmetsp:Transcript_14964/g.25555  ORF Transcript_14964/g.25555 Transcript_14964/m.25555 type:complete len:200 (+) Transcript_14964:52-651(+)